MTDRDIILREIQELKDAIGRLIGVETSVEEPFSTEALNKAALQFQKLAIERGDWLDEDAIRKIIKNAPYGAGAFIRSEFEFTNYFKRGRTYYYNRKDVITLAKELKERNVDLSRYMEYKADHQKFKESLAKAAENKGKKKAHKVPHDLYDITTSSPKLPTPRLLGRILSG